MTRFQPSGRYIVQVVGQDSNTMLLKFSPQHYAQNSFTCTICSSLGNYETAGKWSFDSQSQILALRYADNNNRIKEWTATFTDQQDNNHYYARARNGLVFLFIYVPSEESRPEMNIYGSPSPSPIEFQPIGFWKIHCEGSQFLTLIYINISPTRIFHGWYDTFMGQQVMECDFIGKWSFNSNDRLLQLEGLVCDNSFSIDITIQGIIGSYYYGTSNDRRKCYFMRI